MKSYDFCGWCTYDLESPDDCICDEYCGANECSGEVVEEEDIDGSGD